MLNKDGLIDKMYELGWAKNTMRQALNDMINIIGDTLAQGEVVKLRRLGEMGVKYRPPRRFVSVVTGEYVTTQDDIATFYFKPSMGIRKSLHENNLKYRDTQNCNELAAERRAAKEKALQNKAASRGG